jgi:acyl-CoA dehydrogenase
MNAARDKDKRRGLKEFDAALFGHIGFAISNAVRSLIMALTLARFSQVPETGSTQRYFQHINRFSASFAFATDIAMLTLGGYLKKKESLSARLGDALSCMYLASMVLKHYENQGHEESDLPLVEWACRSLLYKAQEQLHSFLRNFPNRFMAGFMRVFIFPRGQTYHAPSDALAHAVVGQVLTSTMTRDRITHGIYRTVEPSNPLGMLHEALLLADVAEPLEKRLRVEGIKTGSITALDLPGQIQQAQALGILSQTEAATLRDYDRRVMDLIHVDDFSSEEMAAGNVPVEVRLARASG